MDPKESLSRWLGFHLYQFTITGHIAWAVRKVFVSVLLHPRNQKRHL